MTPSGDVWSLGVTLVQVLTNRLPIWDGAGQGDPKLPENIPAPFDEITQNCLRLDPSRRWTTSEIRNRLGQSQIKPRAGVGVTKQVTPPAVDITDSRSRAEARSISSSSAPATRVQQKVATQKSMGGRLAVAAIIVLVLIIAGVLVSRHHSEPDATCLYDAQPAERPAAGAAAAKQQPQGFQSHRSHFQPWRSGSRSFARRVEPGEEYNIRHSDREGESRRRSFGRSVEAENLVSHGPSQYFANSALQAARKWTFIAPTVGGKAVASEWNLKFEFKRSGTKIQPQRTSPRS